MDNTATKKVIVPLAVFFILINAACMFLGKWLDEKKIDHYVLMVANTILFLIFLGSAIAHLGALKNSNPNVFVRRVMATSFVKLILIATAVAIYVVNAGDARSPYAIVTAMLLYIVYTVIEKKGLSGIQTKKDGQN